MSPQNPYRAQTRRRLCIIRLHIHLLTTNLTFGRLKTGFTFRDNLLQDPIPWILALPFADRAFKNYETADQLWAERVTPGENAFHLRGKRKRKTSMCSDHHYILTLPCVKKNFNRMFDLLMPN